MGSNPTAPTIERGEIIAEQYACAYCVWDLKGFAMLSEAKQQNPGPQGNPTAPTTFLKKQEKPKIILYDSYTQAVKNSIGSNLFRNLYFLIGRKKVDILEDGNLSCAVFVSWILYIFKLITDMHTTVEGTLSDLKKSDWIEIKKPRPGAILVWETKKFKNGQHKHMGFYVGNNKAISNRYEKRQPMIHHWTFGIKNGRPVRKIESIFWNTKLNK